MSLGDTNHYPLQQSLPTSTLSLILPAASQNFSKTLSSLKRSTLSVINRLSSIYHDSLFVQQVSHHYKLPLIANERCGSWYIRPERKAGSAYFKSTDGHQGQWSFSTRRLNLQVLDIVAKHGGCIIVDSTRRGKSMPDALSKTIPIWCAVLNRLLFDKENQDVGLYTPETVLGPSEHSQIEARLENFVSVAKSLKLDLPSLRKNRLSGPLRPFFITPDLAFPDLPPEPSFHPIICLTSSRRIYGSEDSENNYIQGAGDDSEGWSHGLTPSLFWRHKDCLMSATEDELPGLIASLLASEASSVASISVSAMLVTPTTSIYVGPITSTTSARWDAIVICNLTNPFASAPSTNDTSLTPKILHFPTPPGKLGSRALRSHLHLLPPFLSSILQSCTPQEDLKILFTCPTGTDLSVGAALVALCLYLDDKGSVLRPGGSESGGMQTKGEEVANGIAEKIDKAFIRRRLTWITTAKPDVRPSRETLQAVNACLIGR
ncbi:MAG: hypothetical protein Q9166_005644 [cf. Caloplaca sp. 2 TL-2023]